MVDRTWEEAWAGNEIALKDLKRVEEEIGKLQLELQAGTIDRIALQCRLENVSLTLCEIAAHVPHFKGGTIPPFKGTLGPE
jgi:hypothetical protein